MKTLNCVEVLLSCIHGDADHKIVPESENKDGKYRMKVFTYTKLLLLSVLLLSFSACETEGETEYNLPGEWYTFEEIDFGVYTWGRGTVMTFNARNQGTIGSVGDSNYLIFRWNWVGGDYNLMELNFYDDNSMAYIWGAKADNYTFSGTWYNSWREYQADINGQPFRMRRQ